MHVELLDKLRCVRPHEDSPLVAAAARTVGRQIVEGTLGCPVCRAEYSIHRGAVDFGMPPPPAEHADGAGAPDPAPGERERAMRLAALLGLDDRGGLYVLDRLSERFASRILELAPDARLIAISPRDDVEGADAVIRGCGERLPLAAACLRGIVLDDGSPRLVESAVHALAPGARLVAPVWAAVPQGITELARDAEQWVGERDAVERYAILASRRSS